MSHRQTDPRRIEALDQITKLIDCLVNIKDETGEYLLQLDDGRIIDTKGWNDWEWTHGIGLYGLHKFHEITGNQEALRICLEWFRPQFALGTTKNVNTMSPLLTAAYIHEAKHMNFLVHLESWAEWVMYEMPRTNQGGLQHITYLVDNNQQLWDDTLMMTVLPLAKIGRILGREHYIEEAKRQFLIHIKYLQDVKTGCGFMMDSLSVGLGWTFDGHHHFAGALWARGNCWATIAIPELIDILSLPPSDGFYMFLVAALTFQIDALVKYQDSETGLWHTIINDPTSYLEASATAGFAYGILKALRMRLIPKEERYISAANKAIQGVQANISPTGELQQVSFGTPVFDTIESYKRVQLTSMPYGQSLALLALTEYLRAFV